MLQNAPHHLHQWFPNILASDPKHKLENCPVPKLVKTADLQAHNELVASLLISYFHYFLDIGFLIYAIPWMFISFIHEISLLAKSIDFCFQFTEIFAFWEHLLKMF